MTNISEQTQIYSSLIKSIGEMHLIDLSIRRDSIILSAFVDYVNQNEAEISKFKKAAEELSSFLNQYDFTKGFQIEPMHKKVEKLHPLRLKLAKMGEEAKKLSVFPDRYGSKKAIDVCRGLATTCREKMSLDETNSVSELVDANIVQLLALQKKFAGDGYILDQIQDVVKANKNTLNKFHAYFAELQRYIDGFPHSGEDNLAVVKNRIEIAKQVEALVDQVGKTIDIIKNYYNRYNKEKVVSSFTRIVNEINQQMCFADVDQYKRLLNDVKQQAELVFVEFTTEHNALERLQSTLNRKAPDIWKEDNEKLLAKIVKLIKADPRLVSFDLKALQREVEKAKKDRQKLIDETVSKYSWLNNDGHKAFHSKLLSKYMSSSEYLSKIEDAAGERTLEILKTIGKVLLYTVGIPVLIVGGLIYLIFKVIFSD